MITLAWRCRRTNLGPQSRHEVDIKNSLKNDWMFVAIVNLKKVHCESKRWPSRKAFSHTSSFLTIAGSIDNNQASMIIIKLSRFWAQKFGWITPNVNINSWFGNLSYSSSTRALVELSQLDFTWAITKGKFDLNKGFKKLVEQRWLATNLKLANSITRQLGSSPFKYAHQFIGRFLQMND